MVSNDMKSFDPRNFKALELRKSLSGKRCLVADIRLLLFVLFHPIHLNLLTLSSVAIGELAWAKRGLLQENY